MKESYGGVYWKVALSGLLDSAFKETKDQGDTSKTPGQESLTRGVWTVQKRATVRTKVERSYTYKTKRKFLQKFGRVTMESSESSTSLTQSPKVPPSVDSNSLETALSPRSKRKVSTEPQNQGDFTDVIVYISHVQVSTVATIIIIVHVTRKSV